jgi:hypothetical protein
MNKISKASILILYLIPFLFFGTFELAFGIISIFFEKCMLPFRWINDKILTASNKINTK